MSLSVYLLENACPHCKRGDEVYTCNVTHNLGAMAKEAGIYEILWRPEENGIATAGQLAGPLRAAVELMKADPARFTKHNPPNGWGSYDRFVPWLEDLAAACEMWPDAVVRVWA